MLIWSGTAIAAVDHGGDGHLYSWSLLLDRFQQQGVRVVVEPGAQRHVMGDGFVFDQQRALRNLLRSNPNVAMVWSDDRYSRRRLTELHLLASGVGEARAAAIGGNAAQSSTRTVANELLLKFKPTVGAQQREALLLRLGLEVIRALPGIGALHLKVKGGGVNETVQQLQSSGLVEYAEPNYHRYRRQIPNDPRFAEQWSLHNSGQIIHDPNGQLTGVAGEDMALPAAWDLTAGSRSVVVAVLDDAVDIHHPDLVSNIWNNPNEIAANGIDDDGNGFVDDLHGWDFIKGDNDPSPDPYTTEGHGTAVAGLIGAVGNNGVGISGVAWQVSLMPLKFAYDVAGEVVALDYAQKSGAHIINASFGGPDFSQAEKDAVTQLQQANILFVAAAGNYDTDNGVVADFPSGLTNSNILSVAASDGKGRLTPWSQYGAFSVDVAVAGEGLLTTMAASDPIGNGGARDYDYTQGTSFSAPLTAGVAALIKAQYPTAGYTELRGRILTGVDPIVATAGVLVTDGKVNAFRALTATPAPLLTVRGISLHEVVGDGDGEADAGETLDLYVSLENGWQAAVAVHATLRSGDSVVTVPVATAAYPDIASDSYGSSFMPFRIRIAQRPGHHRVMLTLDVTAVGGYRVSRVFPIEIGSLARGVRYYEQIQQNDQDDIHIFHINVPQGASNLTISTTASSDIDLIARQSHFPVFGFNAGSTWIDQRDPYTMISGSVTGNETISVAAPKAGVYFVVVVNAAQQPATAYTIQANFAIVDTDGDGVPDLQDAFPQDSAVARDSDGDGFADGWLLTATAEQISASIQSGGQLDAYPDDATRWQGRSYLLTDYRPAMAAGDWRVYRAVDGLDPANPLQTWMREVSAGVVSVQGGGLADTLQFSDGTIRTFTNDASGWRWYRSEQIANPLQGGSARSLDLYSFVVPPTPAAQADFTQLAPPAPLLPATIRAGESYSSRLAMVLRDAYGGVAWQGSLLEVITCDDAAGAGYDLSNPVHADFDGDWDIAWRGVAEDPRFSLVRLSIDETMFDRYGAVLYRNHGVGYYAKGIGNVAVRESARDSYGTPLFHYDQHLMAYRVGGATGEARGHRSASIQLVDRYGQPAAGARVYAQSSTAASLALFEDAYGSGRFTIDFSAGELIDLYAVEQQGDRYTWSRQDLYTLAQVGQPIIFQVGGVTALPQVSHDYTLHRGWNLISFPMHLPPATSVADFVRFVAVAGGSVRSIWSYQSNSQWQFYMVAAPELSTLSVLAPGVGYWVELAAGATLSLTGGVPLSQPALLVNGWNLIGVQSPVRDIAGWLTPQFVNAVWGFQGEFWQSFLQGAPPYLNSLNTLSVGDGYWLWRTP